MFESAHLFETPMGVCGFSWSAAGLTGVQLPEVDPAATAARLTRRGARLVGAGELDAPQQQVAGELVAFLGGDAQRFSTTALDMTRCTAFEQRVYAALRQVVWGETVTYGALAQAAGAAEAARAVGAAMARNAWPLIVPCHRVLAAGGRMGGFSAHGGAVTKAALLAREGVHPGGAQMALF